MLNLCKVGKCAEIRRFEVHEGIFPSDSTSRWTPLPSATSFPLPGGFGTCTLKKRAPPGAQQKRIYGGSGRQAAVNPL